MDHLIPITDAVLTTPLQERVVTKKLSWRSIIKSHFRRISLEILNIFINHNWLFWFIGLINRHAGLIESVFLVYPANEEYGLSFAYPSRLKKNRWNPWFSGLMWQDGKITLMFAISATNGQYMDPANVENLRNVFERMERLRQLFCANRKAFAGILPGVLFLKRIIREAPEADLTAMAVSQAINLVKTKESLGSDTPVVVLGGKGFIGRRVVKMLDKSTTYSIDSADGQGKDDWPTLNDKRIILVNITLNNVIKDYVEVIPPGAVVINEVYPEPNQDILKRLSDKDCHCYHIVGVDAVAFPSFPLAYQGAIPCCAAWPSPRMKVVVRKLTQGPASNRHGPFTIVVIFDTATRNISLAINMA